MAEDVIRAGGLPPPTQPAPAEAESTPTRDERARSSAYRTRFVLVYFILAIALGSAIGALIVVLGSSKAKPAPKQTSALSTAHTGELGAMELADQVQKHYRSVDGLPFVDVIASRNSLQDGSGSLLRVRFQIIQPGDATSNRDSAIEQVGDSLQYSLCGTEQGCAIPGTPTEGRGALLRREGLELALRTFQLDSQVDNVVVFLRPIPAPSSAEGYVLMFDRSTVHRLNPEFLTQPISKTITGAGATVTPGQISAPDVTKIRELTRGYLYAYRYQVVGGHDAVLDLTPAQG